MNVNKTNLLNNYLLLFKTIDFGNEKSINVLLNIFRGLESLEEIPSEFWKLIIDSLKKVDLQNYYIKTALINLSRSKFYSYPDECTIILVQIIQVTNLSHNHYVIDDFQINKIFKEFPDDQVTDYKQYLVKLAKVCLIQSANETNSINLEHGKIYKHQDFPSGYLHFSNDDESEQNVNYFDLLWNYLEIGENFVKKEVINIFNTWLDEDTYYESIIFFVYRFCKLNQIELLKIELVVNEINKISFKYETDHHTKNWLEEKKPFVTSFSYITEDDSILKWQNENYEIRQNYLDWSLDDWIIDFEFELENKNYKGFSFVYDTQRVILKYLKSKKTWDLQDFIDLINNFDFKCNEELKYEYQFSCISILENLDYSKLKILNFYIKNIENKTIKLSGEIAKLAFWFFEKNFELIKEEASSIKKVKEIILSFLSTYTLEDIYINANHQDHRVLKPRITAGTIINVPNGIAINILINNIWKYYIGLSDGESEQQIINFIVAEFNEDKPIVRDSILFALGYASKNILDEYWNNLVASFLSISLSNEYEYDRFYFVLKLLNRWIIKSKKYKNDLKRWVKGFIDSFEFDERDEYQSACIYQFYSIEIWTGILNEEINSIFDNENEKLKGLLSNSVINTVEDYRKYFIHNKNRKQLENRLNAYLVKAINFLTGLEDANGKSNSLLRRIVYDYKTIEELNDYFSYWMSPDQIELFRKIVKLGESIYLLYDPEFLKDEFIQESKELRRNVIDFLELYFSMNKIEPYIDLGKIVGKIMFIIKKDSLKKDKKVKSIAQYLIENSYIPEVLELSRLVLLD